MPRIYQQVDWSNGGDGIVVREAIKTMADLRGKTVVLAQNSPSHFFILNALINAGVQPAEVDFKFTQDAFQAAAAFNGDKTLAGVLLMPALPIIGVLVVLIRCTSRGPGGLNGSREATQGRERRHDEGESQGRPGWACAGEWRRGEPGARSRAPDGADPRGGTTPEVAVITPRVPPAQTAIGLNAR